MGTRGVSDWHIGGIGRHRRRVRRTYRSSSGAMKSMASSEGLRAGVGGGIVAIWGSWGRWMCKSI